MGFTHVHFLASISLYSIKTLTRASKAVSLDFSTIANHLNSVKDRRALGEQ